MKGSKFEILIFSPGLLGEGKYSHRFARSNKEYKTDNIFYGVRAAGKLHFYGDLLGLPQRQSTAACWANTAVK